MSSGGRVRVLVRSRRVPAGVVRLNQTTYSLTGIPIATRTDHKVLYDYVLDEDHQRAIDEAKKLARSLCLGLEVIDSGKQGFFTRLFSSLGQGGTRNPTVELSPPAMPLASGSSSVLPRP